MWFWIAAIVFLLIGSFFAEALAGIATSGLQHWTERLKKRGNKTLAIIVGFVLPSLILIAFVAFCLYMGFKRN